MGKKDKKKGRGVEKTTLKTEKKLNAKLKKHLAEIGEEDIEKILAQIQEEERKKVQIKEIVIEKPTRRANFSFVAHPLKEEILLFGGEFFNGQKTIVYNDLIIYNINKNEWTIMQVPNAPPPRCGHQMVPVAKEKGQLWLFGGEFTSSTQNQFHHYKDLWVFHLGEKRWEKIGATGGPSPRSGHRMVLLKKQIIVFGGYHDNLRDYKYFNDVYAFDLENYKWIKLEPSGNPPAPRSGCQMVATDDGKIVIFGGYSKEKIKKDVDKGVVHFDMFLLGPEKNDDTGTKWKWTPVKQGFTPTPRSACSIIAGPGNKAYAFGGVFDEEENEEDICGVFLNDLNVLDLNKKTWRPVTLTGKKDPNQIKKKRRREKMEDTVENNEEESMSEDEVKEADVITVTDGVFTMTVGPSNSQNNSCGKVNESKIFCPSPRMNCGLAVKNGTLFLYGGLIEVDDKQFTLGDMYSLDLHKLDEWKTLLSDEEASKDWIPSESESEESDGSESDEENENREGDEDMDTN